MKNIYSIMIIVLSTSFVFPQGHWEQIAQPTDRLFKHVFFVDSLTGWCAGADGSIFHTTDAGISWTEQNSTVTTFIVDLFFLNKNLGWALTYRNVLPFGTIILRTTNGGNEWLANDFPEDNVFMNAVFYFDSLNGWLGGSKITSTTDGGLTWQTANIDSNFLSGLPVLNFNFYSRQFGYACGGFLDLAGVIWRTTDFGKNWSATGVSPDEVFDLYIFDSLNAITLSGDPEGFFGAGDIKSSDAGESWSYTELPLTALSFAIDFRTLTEGWSASGFKFLVTLDSGETWKEMETPNSVVIFDLMFTDSITGYAVGENGVVLKYIPQPVSVNSDVEIVPEEFVLHQNYPNPFNPSTRIGFSIPRVASSFSLRTTLTVYDVLGNEIAILVNEEKPAGNYRVEFSANDGANELTSGIYFFQLAAGEYIQTMKMIYLK
jgi:photosystem II stability/assembly factor-like uncharacterized protein